MRGTPHSHCLVCVGHDGITQKSVTSEDPNEQQKVKDIVRRTVTAMLPPRRNNDGKNNDEENYYWNPEKGYIPDNINPSREIFHFDWDYDRNENGDFVDERVRFQYRQLQIANQMHRCCTTCWKYNIDNAKVCRFRFPSIERENAENVVITSERDKKQRIRIDVLPPRNNGFLNATFFNPLLMIAHGGNHDIQYIENTVGAAEYVASYAAKSEEPDYNVMKNLYIKKIEYLREINEPITDRLKLKAAGNAVIGSTQVGSVQACYFLLGLKFVTSSRQVLNMNPLHSKLIYMLLVKDYDIMTFFNSSKNY